MHLTILLSSLRLDGRVDFLLLFEGLDLLDGFQATLLDILLGDARLLAHTTEDAIGHSEQLKRTGKFGNPAMVHDKNTVVGDDRTQAMCDGEEGLATEFSTNGLLNECIRSDINGCGL